LLPILQEVTGKGVPGEVASDCSQSTVLASATDRSTFGMPYTPETASSTDQESDSSSASKYTLEDLLIKKGKNVKSSEAQNFLHVSISIKS
jgi:hypothetical protein